LEYKTQVFINHEGDYFRTRLTHSLEVSQIARTLARELGFNETLAEVIALSHDLGHTPFGHIGGDELDRLLKADGHLNGFEHNFQSFRVVSKLEKRYKAFDGLNLTFATLEGVLKHSYPYEKSFLSHLHDSFRLDKHPSIEAMIVDHADEIAYISHDIDDGVKYGLIDFEAISDNVLVERVRAEAAKEGVSENDGALYRHRFVAGLIKLLVEDFIVTSLPRTKSLPKNEPLCATLDASEPLPVGFSSETVTALKRLKKRLFEVLYRHERIARKMYAGKQCIKGLYTAFSEDADLLPPYQKALFEKRSGHRVIADYIASMTDRYAMKSYHEIYGLRL
jgi:dGTPase